MATIEERIRDAERRLFARYELQVSEQFITLKEPSLRVRLLEVGSGDPVLLLHPASWFAAQWAPLLPHIPGRRLLCLDFPGHGLSDGVDYRREDPRQHSVSMLRALLVELGLERVALVGSSLGGMAALWLAIGEPGLVSRAVILGIPGSVLPGCRPDLKLAALSVPGINQFLLRLPSSANRSRALSKGAFGRAALAQTPSEMFEIHYLAGRRAACALGLATFMQATIRGRTPRPRLVLSDAEISAIAQPVHFIWGADDLFGGPAIGQRTAELMPRATLEVRPGGHFPQHDDPGGCGKSVAGFLSPG